VVFIERYSLNPAWMEQVANATRQAALFQQGEAFDPFDLAVIRALGDTAQGGGRIRYPFSQQRG